MLSSDEIDAICAGSCWDRTVAGCCELPAGSTYRCDKLTPGLVLIEQGRLDWDLDGTRQRVEAPTLVLISAQVREERHYLDRQRHLYLGLRQSPKARTLCAAVSRRWRLDGDSPALALMRLAVSAAGEQAWATVDALARALLALHLGGEGRGATAAATTLPEPLRKAFGHLAERWQSTGVRPVTLAELARAAGMTPPSLCRLCRRHLGQSPMALERQVRARMAVHRLRYSRQAVKRIAEECGFASNRHLGACLRHLYGHGPRALRADPRVIVPAPTGLDWLMWNEPLRG